MEMLQCRFIFASLLVLNVGCFFEVSCQTVYTYTSKDAESLPCTMTEQTLTVIWAEIVVGDSITVLMYQSGNPPSIIISTEEKYINFNYTLEPTSFNMVIMNVEDEDGGLYGCYPFGSDSTTYDVTVEVLAKPTVMYDSQDVDELIVIVGTSYNLTCSATRARSVSDLSFLWDPSFVEKTPLSITTNGNYTDYSITSTYTAVRGDSTITCQLTGYVMQDEINDQRMEHISHTVTITVQYAPVCNLHIQGGEDCREVTLTCECDAVPAVISQYSFFNENILINDGTSNTFTANVTYGTSYRFSCSATNVIDSGENSNEKVYDCNKGTTALPTTTIVTTASPSTNEPTRIEGTTALPTTTMVTTASPSTNEPTRIEATESSTEESMTTYSNTTDSGALGPGAIVGISLGALAVVIVIVVIAVIMCKGKCCCKSESSSVTDVKVTATNSHTTNSEPAPAPVYGEIKKDTKKKSSNSGKGIENDWMDPPTDYAEVKMKSDKLDDNGAGPRGDPEIPAYGVVDKNRTKDPTPAPRSSMRDSTNPSKPKQDGQMEMQYADLDHGNKPASDEVRKPKEEPTEYATVQSVIV